MKDDYTIHNLYWKDIKEYEKYDPHLSKLQNLPFVYYSPLIKGIPILTPGIYILTGGRQVGKTTVLKLIIKKLLEEDNLSPNQIFYLPCDTIENFSQLLFEIDQFRQSMKSGQPFALLIDEITYVKDWVRAIKSLADAGFFKNGSVLLTGSDTCLLKNAMMEFPGRRGLADEQDFHLYPLSFYEYIALKSAALLPHLQEARKKFQNDFSIIDLKLDIGIANALQENFNEYLLTGGYLLAINDYAKNKSISNATYKTYAQWIIGDVLKRGKNELYLNEIIKAVFLRLSKQVTWHSFASDLSIEHHQTLIDYVNLLVRMDVLVVLQAFREDKLRPAPKKAKKICFSDPFIFHALHGLVQGKETPYDLSLDLLSSHSDIKNALIEGCVASLCRRKWEAYYIKAESEVDLVLVQADKFFPIEIKNTLALNSKDLKQILKYKHGLVGYAGLEAGAFKHLQVIPIPLLCFIAN